jgi:sulfite reductase alpha subunit-like flavoprotein
MRFRTVLVSAVFAGAAALAVGQDRTTTTETKQTTVQNPDGSTSTTTITGQVIRYEPGSAIVIRRSNNTEATYKLDSELQVPSDVAVGREVTLVTQSQDGTVHIKKITTMSMPTGSSGSMSSMSPPPASEDSKTTSSREVQQTTETRSTASVAPAQEPPVPQEQTTQQTSTTRVTTVSGTVQAYEPGQSITIVGPNHKVTTYTISEGVQAPDTVAVGKRVTFTTTTVSGKPAVQSFTTKTTTKTTRSKTVSPR